ncbi:MAG TPA: hypothetical protein VFV05_11200 [Methylomirabilota bacterium]|nr:hypothetical protein [Methylomirabilota bacterium]
MGHPAALGLAIEEPTVGAIDTAVNQLPECGHGGPQHDQLGDQRLDPDRRRLNT